MVRDDLNQDEFNLELETMVSKKKYDDCFQDQDQGKDDYEFDQSEGIGHGQQKSDQLMNAESSRVNTSFDKSNDSENIDELWEINAGRMVYNYKDRTLNLGNMQATSYKHNKTVFLPSPESPSKEIAHEFRKREMNRVFKRIVNDHFKGEGDSNLSSAEVKGLKSLKRRISKGELVIADSDKSNKFCVLSQKQYI